MNDSFNRPPDDCSLFSAMPGAGQCETAPTHHFGHQTPRPGSRVSYRALARAPKSILLQSSWGVYSSRYSSLNGSETESLEFPAHTHFPFPPCSRPRQSSLLSVGSQVSILSIRLKFLTESSVDRYGVLSGVWRCRLAGRRGIIYDNSYLRGTYVKPGKENGVLPCY